MTAVIRRTCIYCGRVIGDFGTRKLPNFRRHIEACRKNPENPKPLQGKGGPK